MTKTNISKTNKANNFVSILRALKHILHFSLRDVPSLIFQFFKITFFKTKNFLSRRERCFWGAARWLSSNAAKKNTSLRGGANADEVISWNINYISRDCFATRQLSLTLAMTYSNLLTIFSLRVFPSLIF